MHRSRTALFAFLFVSITAGVAGAAWVDRGSPAPLEPRIEASGPSSSVILDVEVPGFDLATRDVEGVPHVAVALPGHVWHADSGLPELPFIARSIAIPGRGVPSVRVLDSEWSELAVAPVIPSRGHIPRDVDPSTVPYRHGAFYDQGGVYPRVPTELGEPFVVRDLRGVAVRINAFRYDADRGVLLALRRMRLEVVTTGSGGINAKSAAAGRIDPEFDRIYRHLFANYGAGKYAAFGTDGPMLAVVVDALQGAVAPFVAWKQQKGIPVEVITTSSVGGSVSGIQTAISARYGSPEGLTYVVLVGDIAQVPTHTGTAEGNGSDATYTMIDGSDFYADLFVSRISATNPTELETQINKFIRYERDPDTGAAADWYRKGAGLASNEGSPSDAQRADWVRNDLLGYGFTHVDQIYQPTGTTAQIAGAVNAGRSVMYYIGHGSGTSWSNPHFGNNDVLALANGWRQPWIIDVSCSNGTTSLNPCMAEAFLRAGTPTQPHGAVGTFSSWGTCDWVPPTVMMDEAVDLFVAETTSTLGALYFYGAMRALDQYPGFGGAGHALVEQYQIFGDCSLVVRSDEPTVLAPTHLPMVHLGTDVFEVDGLPAGARACLWRDGAILGVADADGDGLASLVLDPPVLVAGDATLTVSGFNTTTYQVVLPAQNAASVVIVPAAIDAGTPTDVTVTVYGPDEVTPLAGIEVWAQGPGYATVPVVTDGGGVAVLGLDYPYGPSLGIFGRDPAETYLLFETEIAVDALPLTAPDLYVSTTYGMSDQFGANLPGTLHAAVSEPGHTLFAILPDGTELSTTDTALEVTPGEPGQVTGVIAVSGHDVHSEAFDVVEVFGTLAGTVADAFGAPLAGVEVLVLQPDTGGLVAGATTTVAGLFELMDPLPVDDYTVVVDLYGYLHYASPIFLDLGANNHDIVLETAPPGDLSGVVTETGTGAPLEATLRVYRGDNGELVSETTCDPADGSYSIADLTYFTYDVRASAYRHAPVTVSMHVDAPSVVRDFVLAPTEGNILIVDADVEPVLLSSSALSASPSRTAADISSDLVGLGYTVVVEGPYATDTETWWDHDLVLVSAADNTDDLGDAAFRTALVDYVEAGGHLLIEGGEIAKNHVDEFPFGSVVLLSRSWAGDGGGDVIVSDPGHKVMSVPNTIEGPIAVANAEIGDADRVNALNNAQLAGAWSSYSANGSVVCYDPTPSPAGGQLVYFSFDYGALDAVEGLKLLHNAVVWLLAVELPGTASIGGRVTLLGSDDHSGVTVELLPDGPSQLTDASGQFAFTGLYEGDHTVHASHDGWSTGSVDAVLEDGESLTDVVLALSPVTETEICRSPDLAIPANAFAGVSDTISVDLDGGEIVNSLAVFVDIAHSYKGDLVVELTSPDGVSERLHYHGGSLFDDIYGWYPSDLTPVGDLGAFAGAGLDGDWELHVVDDANGGTGTLNQWCLRFDHYGGTTAVGDATARFTLGQNHPNPFNPSTTIAFAVPRAGHVSLRVYDLAGRLVGTLVDGELPAGAHAAAWDGRNTAGRRVASGTYHYRLIADGHEETRRMVLIK